MNTRQLSQAIARRLPDLSQADVEEVLAAFVEVVEEEFKRPAGYVYIHGLGRLHVEFQPLHASGIINRHHRNRILTRLYFRFTPARELKQSIRDALKDEGG